MKRLYMTGAFLLLAASTVMAADRINDGTYQMTNPSITISAMIQGMPDGKFFINAEGRTADGKYCRVGDLGEFRAGQLVVGGCAASCQLTGEGFVLNDANNCLHCDAGLTASGKYVRK